MTGKMKAVLALVVALEIVNGAQAAIKNQRIDDLEQQRDIYASRVENWQTRAMQDEETIDSLQIAAARLPKLPDGLNAVYAGEFMCTAYCGEKRRHICGTGTGITASGEPFTADLTVAADQSIFPFGTVLYIEDVGIRVVQDKGADVQGNHLDVAVSGSHEDALGWQGYGQHKVWILKEAEK